MALPKSEVAGVILAAGLSTRFDGEKLTTPLIGRPLGHLAIAAAQASRLGRVVLVTRPELAEGLATPFPGLEMALNNQAREGQASSLRLGLKALGEDCSHVLFLLADQPVWSIRRSSTASWRKPKLALSLPPWPESSPSLPLPCCPAVIGRRDWSGLRAIKARAECYPRPR